jgi:cbb3-type cytochrome oxidase maturation protein
MDAWVIAMMLGVSTLLGALGLVALLWGVKSGQFDDTNKFLDGARFDGEEELRDAVEMEEKRKRLKRKREDKRVMPN